MRRAISAQASNFPDQTGFVLESSTDPTATTWDSVTDSQQLDGDEVELSVPTDGPAQFFRLRKP